MSIGTDAKQITVIEEVTIDTIIESIRTLSEALNGNVFIQKARDTFKENLTEYSVAEDEKAKMIATYEAQVSVGIMSEIIRAAKEMPEILARQASIKEQTKVIKEQQVVERGKLKLLAQQILSERYRHKDLRASTAIKIASLQVTTQQAKFEEARRHIAIKANTQNAFMKKADYKVQQLQAIATDDEITINAAQMADAKETIDKIPTDLIDYKSEVEVAIPIIVNENMEAEEIK